MKLDSYTILMYFYPLGPGSVRLSNGEFTNERFEKLFAGGR
jgi:hypothetical protein